MSSANSSLSVRDLLRALDLCAPSSNLPSRAAAAASAAAADASAAADAAVAARAAAVSESGPRAPRGRFLRPGASSQSGHCAWASLAAALAALAAALAAASRAAASRAAVSACCSSLAYRSCDAWGWAFTRAERSSAWAIREDSVITRQRGRR